MLRKEIEELMKRKGTKTIILIPNVDSELGILCTLSGGYLHDCWGHRVDRKKDFWGFMDFVGTSEGRKSIRKPFLPSPDKWTTFKILFNFICEIVKFDLRKY